jgi:hypothetical protein
MVTILTVRFIPFFLVTWIISKCTDKSYVRLVLTRLRTANVSVVFFPIEVLPTIFRYGYAMPFYNVSRAVRTILFRTRDQGTPLHPLVAISAAYRDTVFS